MDLYHLVIAAVLIPSVLPCSPEAYRFNIPLDEMAHDAEIVVLGLVTQHFPGSDFQGKDYIAEFQVKCTYKGGPLPALVNISNGGFRAGECGYKNFTVGMEYIAFLDRLGDGYLQRYDETKPSDSSLAELLILCGLSVEYPADSNSSDTCIPPLNDRCKTLTPAQPPQPPIPVNPFVPIGIHGDPAKDPDTSGELPSFTEDLESTTSTTKPVSDEATETYKSEEMMSKTEKMMSKTEVMSHDKNTTQTISGRSSSDTAGTTEAIVVSVVEEKTDGGGNGAVNDGFNGDAVTGTSSRMTAAWSMCVPMVTVWTLLGLRSC